MTDGGLSSFTDVSESFYLICVYAVSAVCDIAKSRIAYTYLVAYTR